MDGDLPSGYSLEPFDRSFISILSDVCNLIGVMDAEDVIDGDVESKHQDEAMALPSSSGEDGIAIIDLIQVGAHLGDSAILTNLNYLRIVVRVGLTSCRGLP
jgi:hypothetical protein